MSNEHADLCTCDDRCAACPPGDCPACKKRRDDDVRGWVAAHGSRGTSGHGSYPRAPLEQLFNGPIGSPND